MRMTLLLATMLLAALAGSPRLLLAQPAAGTEGAAVQNDFWPLMAGCGGVYFLAEPGELWVEVLKRDRNVRDTTTILRALLVGPDRQVLQEEIIPDDGLPADKQQGPPQVVRLSTTVPRRGVYALNLTVTNDRYGTEMRWSFRTNCPRYQIETARGHRDERHQEPIVFTDADRSADVCFLPRQGELKLEAAELRPQAGPLQMFDANNTLLATLPVDADGKTAHTFPAGEARDAVPWRLHLPSAHGSLNVDGLTRWERDDRHANVCRWSPSPQVWLPLLDNRWLVTPYNRTVHAQPGAAGEIQFQVHNASASEREIALRLEFPQAQWPVQLDPERVKLSAGASTPVTLRYTAPAAESACHLVAAPVDDSTFSTYATLTVKPGAAPALSPLAMPVMLQPYAHENQQFGYLPTYPLDNQFYFDAQNRPVTQVPGGVTVYRDGQWQTTILASAVKSRTPDFAGDTFSLSSTKIGFDADGDMYLVARCSGTNVLLHSADNGQTFAAYAIPGPGGFDLEQFSGHNLPTGPPAFVRFRNTARDDKLRWRSVNDLELFAPTKRDGKLDLGEPHLISKMCIGFSGHSGMPSSVVSRGDRVHVTWGEATDPAVQVPGVPTYAITYDRTTGKLTEPALIGYGPPANDAHNTPSITIDADGYLHVLVGTHGRPFQYSRSLQPNDAGSGWTEPVLAAEGANQTYIGFVCGQDNTLHAVFRLWRSGFPRGGELPSSPTARSGELPSSPRVEPLPGVSHATLAYQRKRPGQPWEAPRVLIVAPFSEYSVFYHRLTIDHTGRLFLSYDYWSTHWFYRNDHFGNRRAMLMSPDAGDNWQLVSTKDLQ